MSTKKVHKAIEKPSSTSGEICTIFFCKWTLSRIETLYERAIRGVWQERYKGNVSGQGKVNDEELNYRNP